MGIRLGRVYDKRDKAHEKRILIDRLWPRGITKEEAHIDEWCKGLAPSTALRKWFHEDTHRENFKEFGKRYQKELRDKQEDIAYIQNLSKESDVVLLSAVKDPHNSYLTVLLEMFH